MSAEKKKGGIRSLLLKIIFVAAILFAGISISVGDYSHAEIDIDEYNAVDRGYKVDYHEDNYMAYIPDGATTGVIFYPERFVEFTSYAELMTKLAEKGIMVVASKMPYNMPVLGVNKAATFMDAYYGIEDWYIAGHGAGGTAAAKFAADCDDIKGIAMIASYTKTDLTEKDLKTVVMYGTSDAVISMINYNKGLKLLPEGYTEGIIKGANHSYYGNYELNREDCVAKISREEQISQAVQYIVDMINK